MKRKLLACTALVLCLALLCGCTSIATSEWMQDLFPVGDEAVAAQQTGSVNGSEDKQEVKQVVTETYTAALLAPESMLREFIGGGVYSY